MRWRNSQPSYFLAEKREIKNINQRKLCLECSLINSRKLAHAWRFSFGKNTCLNYCINPSKLSSLFLVAACRQSTVWGKAVQNIHYVCEGGEESVRNRDKAIFHNHQFLSFLTSISLLIYTICDILWFTLTCRQFSAIENPSVIFNCYHEQSVRDERKISIKLQLYWSAYDPNIDGRMRKSIWFRNVGDGFPKHFEKTKLIFIKIPENKVILFLM